MSTKFRKYVQTHGSVIQTAATLLGVFVGIGLAFILKTVRDDWTGREVMYIQFVGDMHIRFIQALILPIIICSMISAVGSLDTGLSRGLCVRTLSYYLGTTVFATVFATLLSIWIRPGDRGLDYDDGARGGGAGAMSGCEGIMGLGLNGTGTSATGAVRNLDAALDIVRNVFPPNLVGAALESAVTQVVDPGDETPYPDWKLAIVMKPGPNLLGVIFMSLVYGLVLGAMKVEGKPILDFCTAGLNATMRILGSIMWFFPITTCLLLAGQLVREKNVGSLFQALGWYTLTHTVSIVVHSFVFMPFLYWSLIRKSPLPFIKAMCPAIVTMFGTWSSAATLPVTMECVRKVNGGSIDERISRFVLPIGATVNMDGTAIFRVVLINYLAQLCGKEMGFSEQLNACLMAAVTSIGAPALPGGGMTVLGFLVALGYPVELFAIVLPVFWFTSRISGVTNVLGDAYGAAIIMHLSRKDLLKLPRLGGVTVTPTTPEVTIKE